MGKTNEEIERVAEAFLAACNGGEDALVAALVERLRFEHLTSQAHALRALVRVLRAVGEDQEWIETLEGRQGTARWADAAAGAQL